MNDHQEHETQQLTDEERRWLIADPKMLDLLDAMPSEPPTETSADGGLPPDLRSMLGFGFEGGAA